MKFGQAFTRILQVIWEADPDKGPVWVSKLDATNSYHLSTLQPSHVGTFAYVVPSAPEEDGVIIFIDMVLSMGWVESPKFLCAFSETLTDVANALVNAELPVLAYRAIAKIPANTPPPPHPTHAQDSLTHIDCYMDGVISAVQGGPKQQHQVFDGTVCALKYLLLSLLGDSKYSVSVKKLLAVEGDWTCVKEVLGWAVDTETGTAALPE